MEHKAILVEGMAAPKRIVQEIRTGPRTTTICPLYKKRFKQDDTTVLVDLVKHIQLTPENNKESEITVRVQICELCAQPVIERKQKVMNDLVKLLAKRAVEDYLEELKQKANAKHPGTV